MEKLLKNKENIILLAILIFSAILRLYKIADYMTFLGDEGRDVLVAYNILHGHLTLLGPTSSVGGFFLGPIYYYFMAPFLFLFDYNPIGPAVMVALFGIITVWFVYKIGKEFFSSGVGLTAAFLYALSPLVIAYSRSSWNPNLMPFFTMLSLYVLYKAVARNKESLFILCGFLLGILMQLHYLATFVCFIAFIYLFGAKIYKRVLYEIPWIGIVVQIIYEYFLIILGFLIGFSPFLAFEIRHGFPNIISITKFVFHSKDVGQSGNYFSTIYNVFFRIFARLITDFPPPEQVSLQAHPNIMVWYILTLILGVISLICLLIIFWSTLKKMLFVSENEDSEIDFRLSPNSDDKFLQIFLVFVWFIVGILLFGFYKKQIYDYYFGFLFPLPFILVGILLFYFWKNTYTRIAAVIIFLSLTYINIQAIPFRFAPNRQLAQVEEISKFVLKKTDNKPYNFALITGGNSDYAYRYFFTIWKRPPVTVLNTDQDPKRLSVTDQLLVVCETQPCAPLGNSLWEVAGFGRADIIGHWNVSVVEVYKLVHYKGN